MFCVRIFGACSTASPPGRWSERVEATLRLLAVSCTLPSPLRRPWFSSAAATSEDGALRFRPPLVLVLLLALAAAGLLLGGAADEGAALPSGDCSCNCTWCCCC